MTDVNRLSKFKIGHTKNEKGEKVANAYDLMRALRVPRSDANNCTKTLRGLTETHGLSFGSDLFKAPEAKKACWAPSCTLPQMVEFALMHFASGCRWQAQVERPNEDTVQATVF